MAVYYARSSGNVNAAIWATTPTGTAADLFPSFTSGDVLMLNSFSPTMNVSLNLGATGEVRNDTANGATAGGIVQLNTGTTLTANLISGTNFVAVTQSITGTFTVVGSLTGPNTATNSAGCLWVHPATAGTLNIVGNLIGSSLSTATNCPVISMSGTATVNITGSITGGVSGNSGGISTSASSVINITGNVFGSPTGSGAGVVGTTAVVFNITGNVSGGLGLGANTGAATVNITGTVSGATASGVSTSTAGGNITVIGTCVGGAAAGVAVSGTATCTATRAKGGPLSTSTVGISNGTAGSIVTVDEIEYGDLGASPTSGPIRLADKASNVALVYRPSTTKKTLVDTASTSLLPAASNVRSGAVYNAGQTTGTMAVPPASSVAAGVPVDATVGTAAVTPSLMQNSFDAALSAFSAGRLANVATVASTGQQLANALA